MLKELQVLIGAAGDKQHWDGKQKSKFISGKICAMLILTFPSLVEEVSTSYKADEDKALLSQRTAESKEKYPFPLIPEI